MKAVVATEGMGEYKLLPELFHRAGIDGLVTCMLKVDCQPDGSAYHVAKSCSPALKIARLKGVDLFVLIIDRENQQTVPGSLAVAVCAAIQAIDAWPFEVSVVYKDRTFENWLIADPEALKLQPARFNFTQAMVRQVTPNKADKVKAIDILKRAAIGRSYDKIADGARIIAKYDVLAAAANSRSLRHLLHVLGHSCYGSQCRLPAANIASPLDA